MTDTESPISNQVDIEQIKADAIRAAQESLINKLQGDKPKYSWEERGKDAPSNYDELFEEVKKITPTLSQEDIDRRVEEKLAEREEASKKREEESRKAQEKTLADKREAIDNDWRDLVREKKMPAPAKDIQEKIDRGELLTKEEIANDEGIRAWKELAELSFSKGKSAKLAFYEDYGKQPAGATAPVLGGRPATSQGESEELTYAETVKNRKRLFGF